MVVNFCRFIILFIFTSFIFSNAVLYTESHTIVSGDSFNTDIYLENFTSVAAFQFSVNDVPDLLEGISVSETERTNDFIVVSSEVDGQLVIAGYSLIGSVITAGNGPIVNVEFSTTPQEVTQEVSLSFDYINLSTASGDNIETFWEESIVTLNGTPPNNLLLTLDEDGVLLEWSNPDLDFIDFNIYRNDEIIGSSYNLFFEHDYDEILSGETYCYHVSANYSSGESPISNEACISYDYGVFFPSYVEANPGNEMITISWEEPIYENGYNWGCGDYPTIVYDYDFPFSHYGSNNSQSDNWPVQGAQGADYAYPLLLTEQTDFTVSLCSNLTDFDTKLEIFTVDEYCNPTSTGYYIDDWTCDYSSVFSTLEVSLQPGAYYVVVDGYNGYQGSYEIQMFDSNFRSSVPMSAQESADYESDKSGTDISVEDWTIAAQTSESREIIEYNIYRNGDYLTSVDSDVFTYEDSGLYNSTEYCYQMSTTLSQGESYLSNEVCASPTAGNFEAPTLNSVSSGLGDEYIHLEWSTVPIIDCSTCEFEFETGYGSECCDTAWGEYGIDCATLESNYGWDCAGCSCPGDNSPLCGDGWCSGDEDYYNCPADCNENGCSDGQVPDCVDDDCCSESWIGDGFGDCEDQAYDCDLTCYDNDGGDCDGRETSDSGPRLLPRNHDIDLDREIMIFNIYRDNILIQSIANSQGNFMYEYDDYDISYYDEHCYKVTAVHDDFGESNPSNVLCATAINPNDIPQLQMPTESVYADGDFEIDIVLDNPVPISGILFTIIDEPDLLSSINIETTERSSEFELFATEENGSTTILGFSLTGSQIEIGSGSIATLTYSNLEFENGQEVELLASNFQFSDQYGNIIPSYIQDGIITLLNTPTGCTDIEACNYDLDAVIDDGSCWYVGVDNDYCDCDMNMNDCTGECGGDAVVDCTGECNGNVEIDCNGDCDGTAVIDDCGVCDGLNQDQDCLGICFGDTVIDCAGECGGIAIVDCTGECNGSAIVDCAGECNGSSVEDICGECNGIATDPNECIEEGYSISIGEITDTTLEIIMNNEGPVAGFQFNLSGVNITNVSGGSAEQSGFEVMYGNNGVILGFGFSGETIPASNGLLTLVTFDSIDTEVCISDLNLSDTDASPLDAEVGDCYCDLVVDCAGECGGSAMEDCAGECNGDAEYDCNGECGGSAVEDCNGECGGSAVEDECGVCDGDGSTCEYGCVDGTDICLSLDGNNLDYESTQDIAGFQLGHNGCVNGAFGGDAAANGFQISEGGNYVLAFSFTGSVIPAGAGTLVELFGDVTEDCLFDIVFSDNSGMALYVDFSGLLIDGCTDTDACNYDESATTDDGSCTYPEENYDCDGSCAVEVDCNGDCGGSATEDCAGDCEGDAIVDCEGECGGDAVEDACGECNGLETNIDNCFDRYPPSNLTASSGDEEVILTWEYPTAPAECEEGFVEDCSGDGDCCSESWIGDGFADCEDQYWGCDLSCYDNDGGDCGLWTEGCEECEYNTYIGGIGAECCDSAWSLYGLDCATIENEYGFDCSGCSCPGDGLMSGNDDYSDYIRAVEDSSYDNRSFNAPNSKLTRERGSHSNTPGSNRQTREEILSFKIYMGTTSGGDYTHIATVDSNQYTYTVADLNNGEEYFFVATAVYQGYGDPQPEFESEYSNEAHATPEDFTAPAPVNLVASPGTNEVMLSWESAPDEGCVYDWTDAGAADCDAAWDEYNIDCATLESDFGWDCLGCECPGDGLMSGNDDYSDYIRVVGDSFYDNLITEREESFVGYNVYRRSSGGTYSLIENLVGEATTYIDSSGLTNGQTYYYVVTSQYEESESEYSNEAYAAPMDFIQLSMSQVEGAYAPGDTFDVTISWENPGEVTGIQLVLEDLPEAVTMTNVEGLGILSGEDLNAYSSDYNGVATILWFSLTGEVLDPGQGEIMRITFEVNEDAVDSGCDGFDLNFSDDVSGTVFSDSNGLAYFWGGEGQSINTICDANLSFIRTSYDEFEVHLLNTVDVAGFQFNIVDNPDNLSINMVETTDRTDGYLVTSNTSGTIVGFSITGGTITPGSGAIVKISTNWSNDETEVCFEDIVLAAFNGSQIEASSECEEFDDSIIGCMDSSALNYNPNANSPCEDCCQYPSQVNIGVSNVSNDGLIEVNMSNISDVAGFQFEFASTCEVSINSGSGGSAEDNGFTVSTSAGSMTVLGFSLTGGVIPAGDGPLLYLDTSFDCAEGLFGLEDVIISNSNGESISVTIADHFEYFSEDIIYGCTDESACNYENIADIDDGSCVYSEDYGWCDCDGNIEDCAGECGGNAAIDNCGECNGDNDCLNTANILYVTNINDNGEGYAEITIGYSFEEDVAGFQFDLLSEDVFTVTGGEGGACEDAGFMISTNESGRVIGFSLTGAAIFAGSGEFIVLSGIYDNVFSGMDVILNAIEDCESDGNPACDNDDTRMVLSNSSAETLESAFIPGCWTVGEGQGDCDDSSDDGGNDYLELQYFTDIVDFTGQGSMIIIEDIIGLNPGDEVGIFDMNGVVETDTTGINPEYGETLVGSGVWNNDTLAIVATMSIDLSGFNGPVLNGAVEGNEIHMRVWNQEMDHEYEVFPEYSVGDGVFGDILTAISLIDAYVYGCTDPEALNYNDLATMDDESCYYTISQEINFNENLMNFVSFNIDLQNPSFVDALQGLSFIVAYNDNLDYLIPDYGINDIGDVDVTDAYYVFSSEETEVNVIGYPIDLSAPITISPYVVNLVPYLLDYSQSAEDVFGDLPILLVTNDNGFFYAPSFGINSIDENGGLMPGEGYQVILSGSNSVDLIYNDTAARYDSPSSSFNSSASQFYVDRINKTGLSYPIIITDIIGDIHEGDEIIAYANDVVVGATRISNIDDPIAVTAWKGIYEYGIEEPGFIDGDQIDLRYYSAIDDKEYRIYAELSEDRYGYGVLSSGIIEVLTDSVLPEMYSISPAYPNPFNPSTNIEIGIQEDGHLNIQVLDLNGRIIDTIYDGFIGSGYYIKNWDAVDFPSGIYIVQMNINGFHDSQKVILIK